MYRMYIMSKVQYPVIVDKDVKDAFISVCKKMDSNAAQEIRKFMNEYIKKHAQQDLFNNK